MDIQQINKLEQGGGDHGKAETSCRLFEDSFAPPKGSAKIADIQKADGDSMQSEISKSLGSTSKGNSDATRSSQGSEGHNLQNTHKHGAANLQHELTKK